MSFRLNKGWVVQLKQLGMLCDYYISGLDKVLMYVRDVCLHWCRLKARFPLFNPLALMSLHR